MVVATAPSGGISAFAAAGHFSTAMAVVVEITEIKNRRIARYLSIARAAATDARHDSLREVTTEMFALLGRLAGAQERASRATFQAIRQHRWAEQLPAIAMFFPRITPNAGGPCPARCLGATSMLAL